MTGGAGRETPHGSPWLLLSGAVLLALLFRALSFSAVFTGGEPLLGQADGYYHLRRVMVILENFPSVPPLDRYMAYPFGAECPWPPLFDFVAAAIARVTMLSGLSSGTAAATVLALLPAVLGAVTVIPVFFLADSLLGRREATVAALFFTAIPFHLAYSGVGSGDHHSAETLLLAVCYAFLFRSMSAAAGKASDRAALLSGAALGGAVLTWQGSVVFAVPVPLGLVLHAVLRPSSQGGEERGNPFRRGSIVLATACLMSAAGKALYPGATPVTRFDFGHFSWFQPAFLLCLLPVPAAAGLLSRMPGSRAGKALFAALAGVGAALLPILLIPSARENAARGVSFLLTRHPFLSQIIEFTNYVLSPLPKGALPAAVRILETASMALPALLAGLRVAGELRERRGITSSSAILVSWTLLFSLLAFRQARWQNAFAVSLALSFGWAVVRAGVRRDEWGRRLSWVVAALLAIPSVRTVASPLVTPVSPLPGKIGALVWLRDHSPPTSHLWDSAAVPEYSVLASWDAGHYVQWFARRPTVVNNFGYQLPGEGLEDFVRARFAADEDAFLAVTDRRGVRYVVADRGDVFRTSEGLASLAGIDFRQRFLRVERGDDGKEKNILTGEFRALPFTRLLLDRGAASPYGRAISRLRLVHETPTPGGEPGAMVFERVAGARIASRMRPGEEATFSCRLDTGAGRTFRYAVTARADDAGKISLLFPYSTTGPNGSVIPVGGGVVTSGRREVPFSTTEADVVGGRTVEVRRP